MRIKRQKAQAVIQLVFGDNFFARKPNKTEPGKRCEIAYFTKANKLVKVAAGETWLEAVIAAAQKLGRDDVLASADEVKKLISR